MATTTKDRPGCHPIIVGLENLVHRLTDDLVPIRDMAASGDIDGARHDFATYKRLRHEVVESRLAKHCSPTGAPKCCFIVKRYLNLYDREAKRTEDMIDRFAGEQRMREGYFGDLGRHPRKPRARGGPRCRRVWVRGHKRTTHVRVD